MPPLIDGTVSHYGEARRPPLLSHQWFRVTVLSAVLLGELIVLWSLL